MPRKHAPIPLFHPCVPDGVPAAVSQVLGGRWIGQGPLVDQFETAFREYVACEQTPVAVGSGTDALHLAYLLAGIGRDSEVVAPVFTCAATNLPLLYQGARIRFADIRKDTLNVDPDHVRSLVSDRTRAIVCVHYGGLPCDLDEINEIGTQWGIPVIEDAAQALGARYRGQNIGALSAFTTFSFQALKHITTGDGGMLTVRDRSLVDRARRLRWFGIDRQAKAANRWDGNISEVGYKYQMTDIAAAMGLEALKVIGETLSHRRRLFQEYCDRLGNVAGLQVIGGQEQSDRAHAAWLMTVSVPDAEDLRLKLEQFGIESAPVHYRNDRYDIFAGSRGHFPNMDAMSGRYLCLPLHGHLKVADVEFICDAVRS
jgi:perosamine synthetase